MIALYCSCKEKLEPFESDDMAIRTLICPKCGRAYEITLTEIAITKRETTPTNKFYQFGHRYDDCISVENNECHYAASCVLVEAKDEDEADDILRELSCDWYNICCCDEICTENISHHVANYLNRFPTGYQICVIRRNGKVEYFCK